MGAPSEPSAPRAVDGSPPVGSSARSSGSPSTSGSPRVGTSAPSRSAPSSGFTVTTHAPARSSPRNAPSAAGRLRSISPTGEPAPRPNFPSAASTASAAAASSPHVDHCASNSRAGADGSSANTACRRSERAFIGSSASRALHAGALDLLGPDRVPEPRVHQALLDCRAVRLVERLPDRAHGALRGHRGVRRDEAGQVVRVRPEVLPPHHLADQPEAQRGGRRHAFPVAGQRHPERVAQPDPAHQPDRVRWRRRTRTSRASRRTSRPRSRSRRRLR